MSQAADVQVLLRAELVERLGSVAALRTALQAGTWVRVLQGVYAEAGGEVDLAVRATAATRILPDEALVAGRSLLWLLGIDVLPRGAFALEVVVPRGYVVPHCRGVVAREALVAPGDRWQVDGIRCLRPVRAVADLLRMSALEPGVVVADAAQHARLCTSDQLAVELTAHRGLRGVVRARRVLALSSPLAESPPESRLRLHLVLAGLEPIPQYAVRDADGRLLGRVDLAFPGFRLALEYDGRLVHDRADVFTLDRQRHNRLVAEGWTVLRFTAADLRRPAELVAQVRAALLRTAA